MTNETQTREVQHRSILEQMAREIGSDTWNLTKKVTKATAKGALYLATAPIIGLLDEDTQKIIYRGNEKLRKGATYLSLLPNALMYAAVADKLTEGHQVLHPLVMRASILMGFMEAACRFANEKLVLSYSKTKLIDYPVSIGGFFPSMAIDYLFDKYDSAKEKLKEETQ